MRKNEKLDLGFSIFEVVVATFILTILLLMALNILTVSNNGWIISNMRMDLRSSLSDVFDYMERDLFQSNHDFVRIETTGPLIGGYTYPAGIIFMIPVQINNRFFDQNGLINWGSVLLSGGSPVEGQAIRYYVFDGRLLRDVVDSFESPTVVNPMAAIGGSIGVVASRIDSISFSWPDDANFPNRLQVSVIARERNAFISRGRDVSASLTKIIDLKN